MNPQNSFYSSNVQTLKTGFRELWDNVLKDLEPGSLEPDKEVVISKSGVPTLKQKGKLWYSLYDPQKQIQSEVRELKAPQLAIIMGWGLGYTAQAVADAYPDTPMLIVEHDPEWFLKTLEVSDFTQFFRKKNIGFFLGGEVQDFGNFLGQTSFSQVSFLRFSPAYENTPEWYKGIENFARSVLNQNGTNYATLKRFYPLWIRNHKKNIQNLCSFKPLRELKDQTPGATAVVCAAGPSLIEAIDTIRKIRSKILLISVDTAWKALKNAGLNPDILVVMDGQYWNSRHVDGSISSQTLLVGELTSPPRTLRMAPGRTFIGASNVPFLKEWELKNLGDWGHLKTGGSVTTAAWSLALYLGCSQILFAGLDLGYPQNNTHAKGSQFEEKLHFTSSRLSTSETRSLKLLGEIPLHPQPAVKGGFVLSDQRMDLYRSWIEESLRANPQIKAFNLSSTGSLIRGLVSLSGAEASRLQCDDFSFLLKTRSGPVPSLPRELPRNENLFKTLTQTAELTYQNFPCRITESILLQSQELKNKIIDYFFLDDKKIENL